ncbi:hypothetical protein ACFX12_026272 [Malus domestica]
MLVSSASTEFTTVRLSSDKAEWIRIIASTCSWSRSTILWFLRFRLRRRKRRRNSLHFSAPVCRGIETASSRVLVRLL